MKKFIIRLIHAFIDTIRPQLGPRRSCIYYPVTCRQYAKTALEEKPLWKAIPLIFLRILSCNPLTAWLKKLLF